MNEFENFICAYEALVKKLENATSSAYVPARKTKGHKDQVSELLIFKVEIDDHLRRLAREIEKKI